MHIHPVHDRSVVQAIIRDRRSRDFAFPQEVVDDPSLTLAEKRAILAEWASDRSAVESHPTLRWLSGTTFPVTFASIADARRKLDEMAFMGAADDRRTPQLRRLVTANFARSRRDGGATQ